VALSLQAFPDRPTFPPARPTPHSEIVFVDIVFHGPPGPESGRLVEVENQHGLSVNAKQMDS
jgi:hypothetical protein